MDIKASIIRRGYRMRDRIISQIDVLRALWALPGRRRYGLGRPDSMHNLVNAAQIRRMGQLRRNSHAKHSKKAQERGKDVNSTRHRG